MDGNLVQVYPNPESDELSVNLFLNGSVLGVLLHQRGILLFHGNSFMLDGKGMLLCDHSGLGKSSFTAAFCQNGATIINDDRIIRDREICDLVKACNPWNEGALTFYKGSEVKMMDARVVRLDDKREAGTIISIDDKLKRKCCDGNGIEISMLFYMDTYCPAYHLKQLGFGAGDVFENTPHLKDITPIAN